MALLRVASSRIRRTAEFFDTCYHSKSGTSGDGGATRISYTAISKWWRTREDGHSFHPLFSAPVQVIAHGFVTTRRRRYYRWDRHYLIESTGQPRRRTLELFTDLRDALVDRPEEEIEGFVITARTNDIAGRSSSIPATTRSAPTRATDSASRDPPRPRWQPGTSAGRSPNAIPRPFATSRPRR